MTDYSDRVPNTAPLWAQTAGPDAGLPRYIRVLTGVNEPVLDRMPTERSRYTALACVMVGTSLLGGVSMFFALSELAGSVQLWCVPLALFWSVFVLLVDRWLVSSMSGLGLRSKLPAALMRLLVATVIGFVIAEPLVLQIFRTAVEAQVRTERQQNIDSLRGALIACNPTDGAAPTAGHGCASLRLNLSLESGADQTEIAALTGDEKAVQAKIDVIDGDLNRLYSIMNAECNGDSGPGLTGREGNGPACQQDQQRYNDYRTSHPTTALTGQRDQDLQKIVADQAKVTTETKNADGAITAGIQRRLDQETQVNAPIGLVERFNALVHLMARSGVITAATWLLRFFFILIDSLPVVVKFASGTTPYDRFVAQELDCVADLHLQEMRARRSAGEKRISVELDELNAEMEKRRQTVEFGIRRHAVELEADELAAIDKDYERRLRESGLSGAPTLNGKVVHIG